MHRRACPTQIVTILPPRVYVSRRAEYQVESPPWIRRPILHDNSRQEGSMIHHSVPYARRAGVHKLREAPPRLPSVQRLSTVSNVKPLAKRLPTNPIFSSAIATENAKQVFEANR